jgi:alpha-amylase
MYATFLRNHDQQRVLRVLEEDREAAKLAAALQFALPGVPFIYYGEEIGMSADKPDPQLRTPMHWDAGPHAGFSSSDPWIEIKPDYATVNVERQRDDTGSLHTWYRALIEARRSHGALRIGELTILNTGDPGVLAFVRHKGDSAVLCLFNLTSQTIRLPEVTPPEGFAGDARLDTDLITGRVGASLSQPVPALAPREALYFPVRN